MSETLDEYAPLNRVRKNTRSKCKWHNEAIHLAKQERRKLERKWRKSQLEIHRQMYESQRNSVNKLLEESKRDYIRDKLSRASKDPKQLYREIKSIMDAGVSDEMEEDKIRDKIRCEKFADYFVEKIETIQSTLIAATVSGTNIVSEFRVEVNQTQCFEQFVEVSCDEVEKIMKSMSKKHCNLDPIPTWIIHKCLKAIIPIITRIVNSSLYSSVVPSQLKLASVSPLLKKRGLDPDNLKNFRPVSNLPYISKIMEKVVSHQLNLHLQKYNLREKYQSAYRKSHSTETTLVHVQNFILTAIDRKEIVLMVLLDLSAAFDTVPHQTLLSRLESRFSIGGKVLAWFLSYLSNRQQFIKINNEKSTYRQLNCGVPQGSVLGPDLFTLYTAPLAEVFHSHDLFFHMYADDTQILLACPPSYISNGITKLEKCLADVHMWMVENLLKLNPTKTEFIVFGSSHMLQKINVSDIELRIDNTVISPSDSVRNLGVLFDSQMTMSPQIKSVCKATMASVRNIGRVRKYLDNDTTKLLVNSLILSKMDYCNSLLHGIPSNKLQSLQRLQNICVRIITRTKKFDHITPHMRDLHWLPVDFRVQYKIILLVYKAHRMGPGYLADITPLHIARRCLRSEDLHRITVPSSRTKTFGDRAFSHSAAALWNSLPLTIRTIPTIATFKRNLKTHLFQTAYNSY